MGSFRSKLTLALLVALFPGTADSVAQAQISGIDHYRARLGHGQNQPHARHGQNQPQARHGQNQPQARPDRRSKPNVSRAAYQLPVRTAPEPIYEGSDARLAFRPDVFLLPPNEDLENLEAPPEREQPVRLPFGSSSRSIAASTISTRGKTAINFARPFRRQIEDVFGEEQVPDRIPDLPRIPLDLEPKKSNDGNGIVLPPDAMNRLNEPRILDDKDLIPGVTPRQTVPRPGRRNLLPPRKTSRPEPRPAERDDPRDRYEQDEFDPGLYDPADPRHPNANNGPESWYRPGSLPASRPAQQNHETTDPNVYRSNVAPPSAGYAQPMYAQPGYSQPGYPPVSTVASFPTTGYAPGPNCGSVYADECQSVCNGTPGYANGGCNSCGTGIVNGCIDSMFYLSLFGGYTNLSPITVTDTLGDFRFDLDDGYGVGAALGQYQGRNLRTELEFSFRENDLASLTMPGNPAFIAPALEDAGIRSYSGMANVMWEFIKFPSDRVKPYVGAGFGFVNVEAEAAIGGVNALAGVDDSDSSFGYQAIGGLNFRTSQMLDVFVEYRYLKADSLQLGNFGFDYETSNIFGGARIKF